MERGISQKDVWVKGKLPEGVSSVTGVKSLNSRCQCKYDVEKGWVRVNASEIGDYEVIVLDFSPKARSIL